MRREEAETASNADWWEWLRVTKDPRPPGSDVAGRCVVVTGHCESAIHELHHGDRNTKRTRAPAI